MNTLYEAQVTSQHPLNLLNSDQKIIAEVLNRLNKHIGSLTHLDQTLNNAPSPTLSVC